MLKPKGRVEEKLVETVEEETTFKGGLRLRNKASMPIQTPQTTPIQRYVSRQPIVVTPHWAK
jgi:hypothetical protein